MANSSNKGGGEFYDTLGAEVPKIAICLLSPHLLMDWADFWYGGSFLVELQRKVAIFPFSLPPWQPLRLKLIKHGKISYDTSILGFKIVEISKMG